MKEVGIGLLGFGTVGAGVVEGLQRNSDLIASRLGVRLVLKRIADLDIETDRGVVVDASILTKDANELIADDGVDIVIELIGGTGIAKDLVLRALNAGKPVVTANKALLAKHGAEIFGLAMKNNTEIRFGASVGGGIPIIRALREGLIGNRIESISGILNGTCNYILTNMETEGLSFDKALSDAQEAGYAEADPALDIDGFDTAHKAVILASLAYGFNVPMGSVHVEGIRGLSAWDIKRAVDLGYRIKLLAIIKKVGDTVEVRVHPTLVPLGHVLASVAGVFNAVMVRGDMTEDTLHYGRGAGRKPTASTVISDVADLAKMVGVKSTIGILPVGDGFAIRDISEIESKYYLRMLLSDESGVLGRITSVLGRYNVGIASVHQDEGGCDGQVPVVLVTHTAIEKNINAALAEVELMDIVKAVPVCLRINE